MNNRNITFDFPEKIEKAAEDFCLFEGAEKILVALSGGADSTSLLIALCDLSKKYGFEVFALHVNHMIRGEEADRDEDFARKLCEKYGVGFFVERVDVPRLSKEQGKSLELCARDVRYDAFMKICRENDIHHVATAHTSCDNAETLLFNLVRGSGMRGLCAIPPKRELCEGVLVIRPLIYVLRDEVEEYLCAKGESFVTDSTNLTSDYTRNYIRKEIIPRLKTLNPSLEEGLMRTSRIFSEDEGFLSDMAKENKTDDIKKLSLLAPTLLSRVVMSLFSDVSREMPSRYHVNELCEKIYSYDGNKTHVSFPDGYSAHLFKWKLTFKKDERKKVYDKCTFCVKLSENETFFEESPYALYITSDQNKDIPQTLSHKENVYKLYNTDYLYSDKIFDSLFAENKKSRDVILSGGMHKSLKRILCASCFDGKMREMLPIIKDEGGEVVLVPALCKNDEYKREGEYFLSLSLYIKETTTQE